VNGKTIKDFFKSMMRKFWPDRPRYFNRPLEDKHGCNDEVSSVELKFFASSHLASKAMSSGAAEDHN